MRVTVKVRNTDGVSRKLEFKGKAARAELRKCVQRAGERVYQMAANLTPIDTGYMVDHLRLSFHREGFSYHLGWYAEDFVGTERIHGFSQTPRPRPFYVPYVVFGTSRHSGVNPLTPAQESDKQQFDQECQDAYWAAMTS